MADEILALGSSNSEVYMVLPPEHMKVIKEAGWSKGQVRQYLFDKAQRTAQEWADANVDELPAPGAEKELVPVLKRPESLVLVAGGGTGGEADVGGGDEAVEAAGGEWGRAGRSGAAVGVALE